MGQWANDFILVFGCMRDENIKFTIIFGVKIWFSPSDERRN